MPDIHWLRTGATLALPYLRLSGVEEDELSPDLQLRMNLRTLASYNLTADAGVTDNTISGTDVYSDIERGMHSAFKRDNMPGWQRCLERARADARVAAVVAYDLSRVFRNIQAMLEETKRLNGFGVHLIVNGKVVNLDDPYEWAQWVDQAKHAELESRITTWRLNNHYQEMRNLGINYSHTAPLGLKRTGKRHKVQWSTTEDFPTIVLLCELYTTNDWGSPRLARELNRRGCTWVNRHGERGPVKETTVRKTIGTIEKYQPFLDPVLYAAVLRTRAAREDHRANSAAFHHPVPLLRSLLTCAHCGGRYSVMHQQVRDKAYDRTYWYEVYLHRWEHCNTPLRSARAPQVNLQVLERLAALQTLSDADRSRIAAQMAAGPMGPTIDARQLREKLMLQLRNLEDAYLAEDFGPLDAARPLYRKRRAALEKELAELAAAQPPETFLAFRTEVDARAWLENLLETLAVAEELAPADANRLMRNLFARIVLDGKEVKALEYHPEIAKWLPPL